MTRHNPWNDLLDLVRYDREGLFLARAARYAAEFAAIRPVCDVGRPYGRLLLHQTGFGEVMLAGWRSGARSAPHDHGGARGLVAVLDGSFTETTYQFDGSGLRATAECDHSGGDLLRAPPGLIHDLYAADGGLTLHVYVPRIQAMRVYDTREQTTLLVTGDSGAWIPRAPECVVERRRWARGVGARRMVGV
jgi:predicted metal-dependent enzyme (double-stranded beta helix superfamily)